MARADGPRIAYTRLSSTDLDEEERGEAFEMRPVATNASVLGDHELHEVDASHQLSNDRWRHQRNLDRFFARSYEYYLGKGFGCLVASRLLDYLTVVFIAFMLLFFSYCVDYRLLHTRLTSSCPNEYAEVTHAPDLFSPDCHGAAPMSFQRLNLLPPFSVALLSLFALCWLFHFTTFLLAIPELMEMRLFYTEVLGIASKDLQTIPWSEVVVRLMEAQRVHQLCITISQFDQLDIANIITRRQNYLIALYNRSDLPLHVSIPWIGDFAVFSTSLQWSFEKCLTLAIFDGFSNIREHVLGSPAQANAAARMLRFHMRVLGVANLVLLPAVLVYRIALFVFEYSAEFRQSTGRLSSRHFSPLARWRLRDYCEVDHYFSKRLAQCYRPAQLYVDMFTSEPVAVAARFISIVVGGFFFALLFIAVILDDSFFLANLTPGRSVTWWLGVSGAVLAMCRVLIPDEHHVFDPARKMQKIARISHHYPDSWRGQEASPRVYQDFGRLFQYRVVTFAEEVAGLLVVPYLLLVRMPEAAEGIVDFFRTHTVRREGIGDVCTYALFGTRAPEAAANQGEDAAGEAMLLAGQVVHAPPRPADMKMEHSLINFKAHNKAWRPDLASSAFLETAATALTASQAEAGHAPAPVRRGRAGEGEDEDEEDEDTDVSQLHNSLLLPSKPRLGTS